MFKEANRRFKVLQVRVEDLDPLFGIGGGHARHVAEARPAKGPERFGAVRAPDRRGDQRGRDVRQVVAGIRKAYTPEQLINRRIILVANLAPAVIRGEVSNGMLLAASDENSMALLMPDKDITLGSIIK